MQLTLHRRISEPAPRLSPSTAPRRHCWSPPGPRQAAKSQPDELGCGEAGVSEDTLGPATVIGTSASLPAGAGATEQAGTKNAHLGNMLLRHWVVCTPKPVHSLLNKSFLSQHRGREGGPVKMSLADAMLFIFANN